MRRLFAVAAVGTVLFAGAACGSNDNTSSIASGSTPTSLPTSAAAENTADSTGDNTAEICAAVAKSSEDFGTKMQPVITQFTDAAQAGKGVDALEQPIADFRTALTEYASALRTEAAKASDPELRTGLETGAAAFESMADTFKDPKAFADDPSRLLEALASPEFEQAGQSMEKLCAPN